MKSEGNFCSGCGISSSSPASFSSFSLPIVVFELPGTTAALPSGEVVNVPSFHFNASFLAKVVVSINYPGTTTAAD